MITNVSEDFVFPTIIVGETIYETTLASHPRGTQCRF